MYNKFIFKIFIILGIVDILFWLFLYKLLIPIELINVFSSKGFGFEVFSVSGLIPIFIGIGGLYIISKKENLLKTGMTVSGKILNFDYFSQTSKRMIVVSKVDNEDIYFERTIHNFEYNNKYKGLIEIGNTIDVFINPNNYNEYLVNLDTIRKEN